MTRDELKLIKRGDWVYVIDNTGTRRKCKVTSAGSSWITIGRGTRYHRWDGSREDRRGTARIDERVIEPQPCG